MIEDWLRLAARWIADHEDLVKRHAPRGAWLEWARGAKGEAALSVRAQAARDLLAALPPARRPEALYRALGGE